ncbi:hypothetical protein PDESU_03518 [Pontiella desulfatans]|uniref:Probable membrane transporter protein n=1 Tax=Pontiella desulfatans TaxID=2750659 RepID=A0A6C2U4E7_PONDE|nr:sulfite exporter TauE/SafE family protein [Pontiella desulfatans]VGO14938.1 hypothetical protein PDESU_03518 [Pontiella desulfatans]
MMLFDITIPGIVLRLLLGGAIGFSVGLTGVGGGVLGLQATTLVLGLDPIRAVGTTSLYLFFTNITSAFHHIRIHNISYHTIWPILAAAIPSNFFISRWISTQGGNTEFKNGLELFILGIVFLAVGAMAVNVLRKEPEPQTIGTQKPPGIFTGLIIGLLFGALVGATSVGGIILVPTLLLLGLPAHRTVGTTTTIITALTLMTALTYGAGGESDVPTALVMAAGALIGVKQGSRLAVGLPENILKRIMIGIVAAVAVAMLLRRL